MIDPSSLFPRTPSDATSQAFGTRGDRLSQDTSLQDVFRQQPPESRTQDRALDDTSRQSANSTPTGQSVNNSQTANGAFSVEDDLGAVFGSFNLKYDPLATGVERIRESDGTTILDLTPEARVFIFGAEVTKDVVSVEVSNSMESGGSCNITLANPRGKYRVTQQDLLKRWREDKDILQIYDYDWLKGGRQQGPSFIEKVTKLVGGEEIANQLREIMQTVNNWSRNATIGATRMIYEVKFNSSITKKVGELIFDFRDPVYVFYKGRFSHYWYFAFAGVIDGYSDSDPYGSGQTITLRCIDVLGLLRRKKFTSQGTLLRAGNKETSLQQYDESRVYNLFSDLTGRLDRVIKILFYLQRDVDKIRNTHFYYTPACVLSSQTQTSVSGSNSPSTAQSTGIPPYNTATSGAGSENESAYLANFRENHAFDDGAGILTKQYRVFPLTRPSTMLEEVPGGSLVIDELEFKHRDDKVYPEDVEWIRRNNKVQIEKALKYIKGHPDIKNWKIEGYVTWFHPSQEFQIDLSQKRANNVRKVLEKELGNPAVTFYAVGMGKGSFSIPQGATSPNPDKAVKMPITLNVYEFDSKGTKTIKPFSISEYYPKKYTEYDQEYTPATNSYWPVSNYTGGWLWGKGLTAKGKKEKKAQIQIFEGKKVFDYVVAARNATGMKGIMRGSSVEDAANRVVIIKPLEEKKTSTKGVAQDFNTWYRTTKPFLCDPNQFTFSPLLDYYFQYNEISPDLYEERVLKVYYDTSVRYWTRDFYIDSTRRNDTKYTGWGARTGFGVCGIHPAMSYDFISNFAILPDVYSAMQADSHLLDNIVMTPAEKIREMIFGCPTEIAPIDSPDQAGTHHSLFRPRIFFVYPKIFQGRTDALPWTISGIQTHIESATTTFDALEKITRDEEYNVYASPMGDVFIEPLMYDFHPTKFIKKIEPRDIIADRTLQFEGGEDIYFRINVTTPAGLEFVGYRKDKAYKFNTQADHPFFITLKDQIRVTETLKSEMLKTSIFVQGSITNNAGLEQKVLEELMESLIPYAFVDNEALYENKSLNVLAGLYIADGLPNTLRGGRITDNQRRRLEEKRNHLQGRYRFQVIRRFVLDCKDSTIKRLLLDAATAASSLAQQNTSELSTSQIDNLVRNILKGDYENSTTYANNTNYVIDNEYTAFDLKTWITLKEIAPTIWNILRDLYLLELHAREAGSRGSAGITPQVEGTTFAAMEFLNARTFQRLLDTSCEKIVEGLDQYQGSDYEAYLNSQNTNSTTERMTPLKITLLKELSALYEIVLLSGTTSAEDSLLDLTEEIINIKKMLDSGTVKIATRGDLKALEKAQMYNPREDLQQRVGYNPGPVIKNYFIQNGEQALSYAKSIFNRYLAKAYVYAIDMIGRPEVWLNRTYYLESRQSIGLLTSYNTNFSIDSPFTTSCELSYIRRNSITYAYTLEELDDVASVHPAGSTESRSNSWFHKQAEEYYKGIYSQQKELSRVQTARSILQNNAMYGGWVGIGAGIAGEIGLDVAETLINSRYPKGGIYIAHDFIGHLDYNQRGPSAGQILPNRLLSDYNLDPRISGRLGSDILTNTEILAISDALTALHEGFQRLKAHEVELYRLLKRQGDLNREISELENDERSLHGSDGTVAPHNLQRYRIITNLLQDRRALKSSNASIIQMKRQSHTLLAATIYGYDDITYDITGVASENDAIKGRKVPGHPSIYNDSPSSRSLMRNVIDALPTRIRDKWTVIDDLQYSVLPENARQITFSDVGGAPNYLKSRRTS